MKHQLLAAGAGVLMTILTIQAKVPAFKPMGGFSLERYLGTWYEIARFPHSFEKGLDNVTASYSLRSDGLVRVLNTGFEGDKLKTAEGKAKLAGAADTGHLKVSFFWMFYADYIIVDLDPEYQWVLIAGGSTDYLWILSRTPQLTVEIVERLKTKAAELGFDLSRLIMVDQSRNEGK